MIAYYYSLPDYSEGKMLPSDLACTTLFCETSHEVSIALLGPLRDLG